MILANMTLQGAILSEHMMIEIWMHGTYDMSVTLLVSQVVMSSLKLA